MILCPWSTRTHCSTNISAQLYFFLYMLYCQQIADFGMSRDMETDYYYKAKGGKIPLCWTAPEAVFHRKYTTKSDVWSYGMVMYEIWSLGHKPFEEFYVDQVSTRTFSQVIWLSCDSTPFLHCRSQEHWKQITVNLPLLAVPETSTS